MYYNKWDCQGNKGTGHSPKTMNELEKRKEYWRVREIRKWQMCFFKNGETFFEKMWPLR